MSVKFLTRMAGAVFLAAMALPMAAQQLTTSREVPQQAAPKKVDLKPKYIVAFGRVLARTDQYGATKYSYQGGRGGRLVSETQPNGVVGTYQYDAGKLTGIVYTDGRYITLDFNADGTLSGLTTNTGARVKFASTTPQPAGKAAALRSFSTIQNGISAALHPRDSNLCIGSSDPNNCTVTVTGGNDWPDGSDQGGNDGSAGGGFGGGSPLSGGGGGGGGGGVTNPPNETPQECRRDVCVPASIGMAQYCKIAGSANPATYTACMDKAVEYYGNCSKSCETNDWSWLDFWNFSW